MKKIIKEKKNMKNNLKNTMNCFLIIKNELKTVYNTKEKIRNSNKSLKQKVNYELSLGQINQNIDSIKNRNHLNIVKNG